MEILWVRGVGEGLSPGEDVQVKVIQVAFAWGEAAWSYSTFVLSYSGLTCLKPKGQLPSCEVM